MRAVIICGGAIRDYDVIKEYIKGDDIIICADSGYDHAVKMGLKVDIVLGDFDSISEIPSDIQTIKYPARKDCTDSEIALEYARSRGFNEFLLIAATGTRLDHTLANILLLKKCLEHGENAVIADENNKIMITDSELYLEEIPGTVISLIPLSECSGVIAEGFEYPLHNAALYVGESLGVSNVITESNARVSVESGVLLIIAAKD